MKKAVRACIFDIEGTICSINFVHKTLFTYVREHLDEYLTSTWDSPQTKADVEQLIKQSEDDLVSKFPDVKVIPRSEDSITLKTDVIANVLWQMSIDRKIAALKNLQGHMWKKGYAEGALSTELYDDFFPFIKNNLVQGKKNYIYSSGSVGAQKLLLSYSKEGNLLDSFSGFFDTNVGHKREQESYHNISQEIGIPADECVFYTDIYEEAVAADAAGMNVVLMIREGNAPLPESNTFPTADTFTNL